MQDEAGKSVTPNLDNRTVSHETLHQPAPEKRQVSSTLTSAANKINHLADSAEHARNICGLCWLQTGNPQCRGIHMNVEAEIDVRKDELILRWGEEEFKISLGQPPEDFAYFLELAAAEMKK